VWLTEVEGNSSSYCLLDGEVGLGLGLAELLLRKLWWCDCKDGSVSTLSCNRLGMSQPVSLLPGKAERRVRLLTSSEHCGLVRYRS
jgi:hypothetical protein